jgi:uncharacterized protein with GYD domain
MHTYYLLGKYSVGAAKHISSIRTDECVRTIEELNGEIILLDALLGDFDLAVICKFEDNCAALKASVALEKRTGIRFTTLPAVPVSDFDRVASEV